MPATIAITNVTPYTGNYQSFNAPVMRQPQEGNRTIPISIKWDVDAIAPDFAVGVDVRSQRNLTFSQITSLFVDNLSNDADAAFYFPDTQFRLDVPAYSIGVYPVVTNGLQFVAYSPSATDGDSTFVQIMNFYPPPITAVATTFQSPAVVGGTALPVNTTNPSSTAIYTGAGTLRALEVSVDETSASAAVALGLKITDGSGGTTLWTRGIIIPTTELDVIVTNLSGLQVPFSTGLELVLTAGGTQIEGGFCNVNAYITVR